MPTIALGSRPFVRTALAIAFALYGELGQAQSLENSISAYSKRYALDDPYKKLVGNRGDGYEELRGVRNFRVVFAGAMYRGGANNAYRRPPISVANPLPPEALENLCKQGFRTAVDLYTHNFDKAKKLTHCTTVSGQTNTLRYLQISAKRKRQRDLMELISSHLQPNSGHPLYVHCQNGWHASGLVSALALRQFCGISSEQAIAYFNRAIDDVHTPFNKTIRAQIQSFSPFADLQISESLKQRVCPRL